MKKNIINFTLKIINFFIIKQPYSFYFTSGISCRNNCEDAINYDSNNSLSCLVEMLKRQYKEKMFITVEYTDYERISLYEQIADEVKKNNIDLRFVYQPYLYNNKLAERKFFLKKYFGLFKHRFWIVGTGDHFLFAKLKSQKIINTNYFISCKNDLLPDNPKRWEYIDEFITCSLLHSTVSSAQTGVLLNNCKELGFPRNDCLFEKRHKDKILSWIVNKIGYIPNKIIVYAPTYRDYENDDLSEKRFLFGYDMPELEEWIKDNNIAFVSKLHNLQARSILNCPKGVIAFEPTYEFSFYDLLSISDCLITDYSSVGYDYMLLDRPIIYNLYDYDYYVESRGVSYEPYDCFCPGMIVKDKTEMMNAIKEVVDGVDSSKEKRRMLTRIIHKNPDNNSTKRVVDFLLSLSGIDRFNE